MTNEQCLSLKAGQEIYSNHGASPITIVKVPLWDRSSFIVRDIHDCEHVESREYIKNNFEIKPINYMTKEEAKHLSDVLKAYSEGKEIEIYNRIEGWIPICKDPRFVGNPMGYRIKPEPKLRPYANAEEFLNAQKEHNFYIKEKRSNFHTMPWNICDAGVDIIINNSKSISFRHLLIDYIWQDGTPCGILEE